MATTYYSPDCKAGNNVIPRAGAGLCSVSGQFNIATDGGGVAFVDEDVVQMVKIPAGATVLEIIMDVPPLDTSTGLVWAVGDGDSAERYMTGQTAGRSSAGGVARLGVAGSSQYASYTADDTIDFHVTTVASGTAAVTGILKMTVIYTFDA